MGTRARKYIRQEMEQIVRLIESLTIREIVENQQLVKILSASERILANMAKELPRAKVGKIHRAILDKISARELHENTILQKHIVDEVVLPANPKLNLVESDKESSK